MKYRDKPALQQKLAAEYVLGTLRGPARARFQTWLREDAALRNLVAEWEERLMPLTAAVEPAEPPHRVWRSVEARIDALGARVQPRSGDWWNNLAFWRNWGLIATSFAAAVLFTVMLKTPDQPIPQAPAIADSRMQPSYIAVLHAMDDKNKLMFMAYAGRKANELWVKRVSLPQTPATHSYELWAMPAKPGEAPRSLGIIPPEQKATMQMVAIADTALKDVPELAITMEPAGGSRTGLPSGPMIAKGECFNFW
jgi:anti-sigma-K factor RskA